MQLRAGLVELAAFAGGEINLGNYLMQIASDGTFGVSYANNGTIGGTTPYAGRTTIAGHLNGPTAVGTLEDTLSFVYGGIAYACGSGRQTWTATRTS